MGFFKAIHDCFTGEAQDDQPVTNDKIPAHPAKLVDSHTHTTEEEVASSILTTIFSAEKSGPDLERRLQELVRSSGWSEGLAKRILDGLVDALNSSKAMGGAVKEAFDKASAVASEFVHEHPVFVAAVATVVAIGILVILVPWAVEVLGFGELGPAEGEFEASPPESAVEFDN